jgi:hypothetical protein
MTASGPGPVSFTLFSRHLDWLDAKRRHGSLSRSAALRQALDALIAIDAAGGALHSAVTAQHDVQGHG